MSRGKAGRGGLLLEIRTKRIRKLTRGAIRKSTIISLAFLFVFNTIAPAFAASNNSAGNENLHSDTTQNNSIQNINPTTDSVPEAAGSTAPSTGTMEPAKDFLLKC